jgi:hypothetical protein
MADSPPAYRKATRRNRTLGGYSQLWFGDGHLLLVKSTRFSEEYQRFAFSAIQAITVAEVPFNVVPLIILAVAATASLAWALSLNLPLARAFALLPGVLVLAGIAVNFGRGPRCRCFLHTAVTRERLAPVSRMRIARKFLARVAPEIEAVQGTLTPEHALTVRQAGVVLTGQPPEVPRPAIYIPEILFGLLLLDAALVWADVRFSNAQTSGILATAFPAEVVMAVFLLLASPVHAGRRSRVFSRAVSAAALLCMLVDAVFLIGAGTNWFMGVLDATRLGRPPSSNIVVRWPATDPFPYFGAAWRAAAGAVGLAVAWWERRKGERR